MPRISIDLAGTGALHENTGSHSVDETLMESATSPQEVPLSKQGIGLPNILRQQGPQDSWSARVLDTAFTSDVKSAWDHYSQRWSQRVENENTRPVSGSVRNPLRNYDSTGRSWWPAPPVQDSSTGTVSTPQTLSQPERDGRSWLAYAFLALVIAVLLVLGITTLL